MLEKTPADFWQELLKKLRVSLAEPTISQWFEPLRPISLEGSEIVLVTDTAFGRDFIQSRYNAVITDAAQSLTGRDFRVRIVTAGEWQQENGEIAPPVEPAAPTASDNVAPQPDASAEPSISIDAKTGQGSLFDARLPESGEKKPAPTIVSSSRSAPLAVIEPGDRSTLRSDYTFDNFVIGNSNRFANAAAQQVAEAPGMSYNPFFIYGGVGLGKTHLMHAIGNKILENFPDKRVLYVTSEVFTNEFINAIRDGRPEQFRQKYRKIDTVLVDDIQFLYNKESTQEEFFHTFNTLYNEKKQIVLSSDRKPRELKTLEDRLRSRFEWGLITDIQAPDLETRIAILKKKAMIESLAVPDEVLVFIASRIDQNIRELEGALTRVVAYSSLYKETITTTIAQKAMEDLYYNSQHQNITIELIQEIVSNYYKITRDDLIGKSRSREFVVPRQIAIYLCRDLTQTSLPQIGRYFGDRDHTTVMHAYNKIRDQRSKDAAIDTAINELVAQINRL